LCSNTFWIFFAKILQINHQTTACERHIVNWQMRWQQKTFSSKSSWHQPFQFTSSSLVGEPFTIEMEHSIWIPEQYWCPIMRELMKDSVVMKDRQTYEREAIATALTRNPKWQIIR
jgi:hypothetical protein